MNTPNIYAPKYYHGTEKDRIWLGVTAPGWWWCDERLEHYGPFATEEEAMEKYNEYFPIMNVLNRLRNAH